MGVCGSRRKQTHRTDFSDSEPKLAWASESPKGWSERYGSALRCKALPERQRWQWTSKGNKAHERIGCRTLATGLDTTDSSVEQRPEVDCLGTRAIAQTPVWSALEQLGEQQGRKRAPTMLRHDEPRKTPMQQSRVAPLTAQANKGSQSQLPPNLERGTEAAPTDSVWSTTMRLGTSERPLWTPGQLACEQID
jgi:hypothetical protein